MTYFTDAQLKSAFVDGRIGGYSFLDLLENNDFCTHPKLYSIAQEVFNESSKENNTNVLVRVYSILTAKNIYSLPSFYQLLAKRELNNSIYECEKIFKNNFDSFLENHGLLTSDLVDPNKNFIDTHLKHHFRNVEKQFKTFDAETQRQLGKDWDALETALIHDDFSTAKKLWNSILETCIQKFSVNQKNFLVNQHNCDWTYMDKKGMETYLISGNSGLTNLMKYLLSGSTQENSKEIEEYDDFEVVDEQELGALERASLKEQQIANGEGIATEDFKILNEIVTESPGSIKKIVIKLNNSNYNSDEIDNFNKNLVDVRLEEIEIDFKNIKENDIKKMPLFSSLQALFVKTLTFTGLNKKDRLDTFLEQSWMYTKLESLSLKNCTLLGGISREQMRKILNMCKDPLKSLDLTGTGLSKDAQDELIKNAHKFTNITLTVSRTHIHPDYTNVYLENKFPNIKIV